MGTPCSVTHPYTVPCDTPIVGTPAARAAALLGAKPCSSVVSCSPTAADASVAPTAAATTALLTVGTQESTARVPGGSCSKRQPCDSRQHPSQVSAPCCSRSAT